MDMIKRPRRLRSGEALRKMVRETRVSPSALIYPAFVVEGEGRREEIPSMPGQYHYSVDKLLYKAEGDALRRGGQDDALRRPRPQGRVRQRGPGRRTAWSSGPCGP